MGLHAFVESCAYDPLGRRVRTTAGSGTVFHVYDGDRCVADFGSSGNILRAYTWGPGVDSLLALTVYPSGASSRLFKRTRMSHYAPITVPLVGLSCHSQLAQTFGGYGGKMGVAMDKRRA